MQQFEFKPIDQEGAVILDVIAKADAFNYWMYQTIKPYCKGRVLELGSGIGNISQFFLEEGFDIMLSDIRNSYCAELQNKFNSHKHYLGVDNIDLVHPDFDLLYGKYFNSFDTAFALNVVEHIYDDALALANAKKFLKPDGHLIILVPSYQFLYNNFDKELEHYRRYTVSSLKTLFEKNNYKIIHQQYYNFAGIAGWFVSGSILKKKSIPEGQMGLFNKLVPIFKIADKVVGNKIGLSSIVVGQK